MATDLNETFMIRTSTPEMPTDEGELSIEKIHTNLAQVQLKEKSIDENKQQTQTQRHQTPPMELVILPKTQDAITVNETIFMK